MAMGQNSKALETKHLQWILVMLWPLITLFPFLGQLLLSVLPGGLPSDRCFSSVQSLSHV